MQQPKVLNATGHSGPPRLCMDCPKDISLLSPKALRCKDCAYEREKTLARERGRRNYQANPEIVRQRVKEYQQTAGGKQKRQDWEARSPEKLQEYRQREKQKRWEKTGYNPEGRMCQKCHVVDISDKGHRAKYCDDCVKPPTRTCEVCKRPFKAQGSRTEYCDNPQCKQEYWRLKEEQGYTKVCSKCEEEKLHTDFGFHSGRRRSVCKVCESSAVKVYIESLPPEERRRRKRVQHQREKEKYDNLPLKQKMEVNAKRLAASRRRKYGSELDVEARYLEQDGKCAICRRRPPREVDHDRVTGRVRGLLCKNCNLKLVSSYENGFPPERQDWPYMNEYLARGKRP